MSTTIDDRVVEMRFDNSNFETNCQQTLSTLDRLKQALNLPGASKGLEDVSAAASKCDLNPLSKAVDHVSMKFSALDVVAFTALQNITNSVLNTSKKIIDQFTIEPIRTGFSEYELKMGSVQTIMASTGESIDTVNKYLEELNKYSDQTIYSFSDMTNSIGKFTNAGVSLHDAVTAIKGVSNEAAVSGANANEASRAMYNFAQALSAGYVKLIDWKSIENANMATVEFKNELIKTAVEVGTLTKNTEGLFDVIKDGEVYEVGLDATHNFNDSLQKQWMTTEVLTKTLARYADELDPLGQKAYAAAQDVKTFSMMMDTLKEAAQSGWATTWEIVVGDLEEAKVVFTDFADIFSGVIGSFDDARNKLLSGGLSSSWKQFSALVTDSGVAMDEFEESLANVVNSHGSDFTQMILDHENLANAIQNGAIKGEWLSEAYMKLTENAKAATDETTGLAKYTEEELGKIDDLRSGLHDVTSDSRKLLRTLTAESGRQYIFETLKNSLLGVIKLTSTFTHAWRDIIPPALTSEKLYKGVKFIGEFSRKLVMSDETADKLRRTLHGLFVPIDLIGRVVGGVGNVVLKVLSKALGFTGKLNFDILGYTAKLGDALTKFHDWVVDSEHLGKYLGIVEEKLTAGLNRVKGYIQAFLELPAVAGLIDKIKTSVRDFSDNIDENLKQGAVGFKNFAVSAYHFVRNLLKDIKNLPIVQKAIGKLKAGLKEFIAQLPNWYASGSAKIQSFIDKLKNLDEITLDDIKNAVKDFGRKAINYFKDLFNNVNSLSDLLDRFKEIVSNTFGKLENKLGVAGGAFAKYTKILVNFVKEHKGAILAIGASVGMILTVRKIAKSLAVLAKPLFDIGNFLNGVSGALNTVAKGLNKKLKSEAIKNYAISLAILAGSLIAIAQVPAEDLKRAVIAMGALAAILVVLSFALGKFSKLDGLKAGAGSALKGTVLMSIAGSLVLLVQALKQLDELEHPEQINKNLFYLAVLAVGLIAVVKILNGKKGAINDARAASSAFQMVALAGSLLILVRALDKIGNYDLQTIGKSIVLLIGIAVAFRIFMKSLAWVDWKAAFSAAAGIMALLFLVKAFEKIANLDMDKARNNFGAFIAIFALYLGLMAATKLAGKNALQGGVGILAMAASLIAVAVAIKMLAKISVKDINHGLQAILKIFAIFAIVIAASYLSGENAIKAGVMVGIMSASLILIAGAIAILSTLDPKGLDRAVDAIRTLIVCFALIVAASGLAGDDAYKTVAVVAAAVGILAISLAGLSMIPEEQLKAATKALVTVMIAFGLMSALTSTVGKVKLKTLTLMVAALGIIALALYLLKDADPKASLANAASLSLVLLALAAAFRTVGNVSFMSGSFAKEMGIMLLALGGIALILGLMSKMNVEASIPTAVALSTVLLAFSVSLRILDNVHGISSSAYNTVGTMFAILGIIAIVLGILVNVPNIDKALTVSTALSEVLLAFSGACLILSIVGKIAGSPATAGAALSVAGAAGVIVTALIAIAGIISYIPGAEDFIDRGVDILKKVATGMGEVIGGFISGLTGLDSLSDMGDELSAFGESIKPFFDYMKTLEGEDVLKGIGVLVSAITAVTAADAINGFRSLPIIRHFFGTGSLGKFGEELAEFAEPLKTFISLTKDIKPSDTEGVSAAASAVAEFAAIVPNEGGLLGMLVGNNDLSDFGEELRKFAIPFKTFVTHTKDIKASDTEGVSAAATAVAEFANAVPNQGLSLLSMLVGDNKLSTFGEELRKFAIPFKTFVTHTKDIKASDVEGATAAATSVAKFAKIIPNQGTSVLSFLVGDNKLSTFGEELRKFAIPFKTFVTLTKDISDGDISGATSAATTMAEFAKIVPKNDGILGKIFGGSTPLSQFGSELESFGKKFSTYNDNVSDIDTTKIDTSIEAAKKVLEFGNGKAPDSGVYQTLMTAIGNLGLNFKGFYKNIKDLDPTVVDSFVSMVNTVAAISSDDTTINGDAFAGFSDALQKLSEADFSSLTQGISTEIPNVSAAINGMMTTMLTTISNASPQIQTSFSLLLTTMVNLANSKSKEFSQAGIAMMTQFIIGFAGHETRLPMIMADAIAAIIETITANEEQFRTCGEGCINAFANGFVNGQKKASTVAASIVNGVVNSIATENSNIENAGAVLIKNFANGLMSGTSATITSFKGFVSKLVSSANSYNSHMRNAGRQLISNFVNGVRGGSSGITTAFTSKVTEALAKIKSYNGQFFAAGMSLANNVKSGASNISISGSFETAISNAVLTLKYYYDDFYDAGEYLVKGFRDGIKNKKYLAVQAATDLGASSVTALAKSIDAHSPSRLAYRLGSFFDAGYANAIGDKTYLAVRASEKLGKDSTSALGKTLSKLSDMVDGNLDVNPTIRPVVDLSAVQSGINQANDLLNFDRTVDLGYSGVLTNKLVDTNNAISQQEQLSLLRKMSNLMDTYFPQFNENDVYLDSGVIAGAVNRKLGLQT